ncbi:hypothetical protein ABB55_14295 [Prosthecomicrobium hirschii]|uniref:Uncharacterized protein n=2 Tax=Prosthecodimorpha hirschii TaxID=665126 RepID=A0A0P6VRK9_9HYPH|nr:hypothetical protein ABB55_14295 [Prosthecomicrobium hirschii]
MELAAGLETFAQERGVPLDSGESLIAAVAASRASASLLTGDKRAIEALEDVSNALGLTAQLAGKVVCLEQLMASIGLLRHPVELQTLVCAEVGVDGAMGMAFRCRSKAEVDAEALFEALRSYIDYLRSRAPMLLLPGYFI